MNTTGITDTSVRKVIDSKGTKLTQKRMRIVPHGSFRTFSSQDCARKIMGANFFGVEEAIKHFGVTPSKRELAYLADVPFSKKTLTECKYTHVLIAVFPLSILDIRGRVGCAFFHCHPFSAHDDEWYNKHAFAKDCGRISWYLIRKYPVPNSTKKTWRQQQLFLGMNEKTPSARVVIYTTIGHFLSAGERLFTGTPCEIRCSDRVSPGRGVVVGNSNHGVVCEIWMSNFSRDDQLCTLGVSSAREF